MDHPLPSYVMPELQEVVDQFLIENPVLPLLEKQATLSRVYSECSQKRIIHFAAHAVLGDMKDPMKSAVVLASEIDADGKIKEGYLSLETLLTHWADRLKGTDLVVLSCCQTGRGVKLGDSLMGLPIGFFHAGARCIIASLWLVDDLATCLLMIRFYQNYLGCHENLSGQAETQGREIWGQPYLPGQSMPITHALAEAKSWLKTLDAREINRFLSQHPLPEREQSQSSLPIGGNKKPQTTRLQDLLKDASRNKYPPFRHPRFWAAFIVIGDTD